VNILDWITTAQAWAATAEAEPHAPSISELIFPFINFAIYVFLIVKFVLPPVRDYLRSRRQEVVKLVEGATEDKQRIQAIVQDYTGRLARVDQEIKQLLAGYREEAEREKAKLLQDAERGAEKIQEDAEFLAEQEIKVARQKIREELAATAVSTARDLIRKNFSAADQNRMVSEFIANVGNIR
jgi:F-type H+-transporting ATPase subunit b